MYQLIAIIVAILVSMPEARAQELKLENDVSGASSDNDQDISVLPGSNIQSFNTSSSGIETGGLYRGSGLDDASIDAIRASQTSSPSLNVSKGVHVDTRLSDWMRQYHGTFLQRLTSRLPFVIPIAIFLMWGLRRAIIRSGAFSSDLTLWDIDNHTPTSQYSETLWLVSYLGWFTGLLMHTAGTCAMLWKGPAKLDVVDLTYVLVLVWGVVTLIIDLRLPTFEQFVASLPPQPQHVPDPPQVIIIREVQARPWPNDDTLRN